MVTTTFAGRLTSRPLTTASVQTDHLLFLVDRRADWLGELGSASVHVTVSGNRRNDWLAVNGTATLNADRALIRELWSPPAGAYFDGEEDPNVTVLDIEVSDGEFWSAPGAGPVGRLISVVASALGRSGGTHGAID